MPSSWKEQKLKNYQQQQQQKKDEENRKRTKTQFYRHLKPRYIDGVAQSPMIRFKLCEVNLSKD